MDWTHTKSSESVRNDISLSGEKDHQKKHQHRRSKREFEKDVEDLKKELANCKLQLEAKHAAYMQSLRKVEHYQRLNSELLNLLKKSDSQRKKHMNEGNDKGSGIGELESMMKGGDDQLRNPKFKEQISQFLSELKTKERMLLNKEVELLAAKDSELKAQTKIDEIETAFNIEKEEKKQILQQLEELVAEKQRENHNDKGRKEKQGEAPEESNSGKITIPLEEYESLMRKVEQANEAKASMTESGSMSETMLKMELEAAKAKIGELRARAEQAHSRAELAEKANADIEHKLKRHREKKQRRKAAMVALEEESTPSQFTPSSSGATPQVYETLSKILNLRL
ncbi:hypothetical protein QN277_014482 [Acacia crassicarpa]|uniref:Uncharacterized protein n=1 Tax=Acacia crassicarpa TaxID=499986 RepID=A0AAE1M5G6_9FABA|nr:hypothetical protein QN277_014482 [Acacia crassicarpa]